VRPLPAVRCAAGAIAGEAFLERLAATGQAAPGAHRSQSRPRTWPPPARSARASASSPARAPPSVAEQTHTLPHPQTLRGLLGTCRPQVAAPLGGSAQAASQASASCHLCWQPKRGAPPGTSTAHSGARQSWLAGKGCNPAPPLGPARQRWRGTGRTRGSVLRSTRRRASCASVSATCRAGRARHGRLLGPAAAPHPPCPQHCPAAQARTGPRVRRRPCAPPPSHAAPWPVAAAARPPAHAAHAGAAGGARAGARQEDGHGARQEPPHGRRALHVQAQDDVRAARQRVGHLRAPARASAGSHQGPARRRGRAAAGLCLKQSAAVRRAPATAGCPCSPHTLQRAPAARPPRSTPQTAARSRTGSPRRAARPGASACARARGSGGGGGCGGFYGL